MKEIKFIIGMVIVVLMVIGFIAAVYTTMGWFGLIYYAVAIPVGILFVKLLLWLIRDDPF